MNRFEKAAWLVVLAASAGCSINPPSSTSSETSASSPGSPNSASTATSNSPFSATWSCDLDETGAAVDSVTNEAVWTKLEPNGTVAVFDAGLSAVDWICANTYDVSGSTAINLGYTCPGSPLTVTSGKLTLLPDGDLGIELDGTQAGGPATIVGACRRTGGDPYATSSGSGGSSGSGSSSSSSNGSQPECTMDSDCGVCAMCFEGACMMCGYSPQGTCNCL